MLLKEKTKLKNNPATLEDVENSADEVMRSCAVQFSAIDKRFNSVETRLDNIEATMVTKTEFNALYNGMINRFDAVDRRFNSMEEKIDNQSQKIDSLIIFMRSHEKQLQRINKHLAFC